MSLKKSQIILGIESSCDETAAAVVKKTNGQFLILSNVVSSQIKIHQQYGGVVPEVAARNHIKNIIPVIEQALADAKITPKQIEKIAATSGPGLITSLMVGAQTAKTLAYLWQKPIAPINHLRGHIYANWLTPEKIIFPALCLVVSGGHTELILIKNENSFKKIGQTLDDAAGEAFDKAAQLLNIGYPGGPIISRLAAAGKIDAFDFPRPMLKSNDFNFSFSGLKTAVLYKVKKLSPAKRQKEIPNLCASFQAAAVEVLVAKTLRAAKQFKTKTIMICGGVAANPMLRETMKTHAAGAGINFLMPEIKFCTDNAVMIALAGFFAKATPWEKINVDPNWEI